MRLRLHNVVGLSMIINVLVAPFIFVVPLEVERLVAAVDLLPRASVLPVLLEAVFVPGCELQMQLAILNAGEVRHDSRLLVDQAQPLKDLRLQERLAREDNCSARPCFATDAADPVATRKPAAWNLVAAEHPEEGNHVTLIESLMATEQTLVDFSVSAVERNDLELQRGKAKVVILFAHWDGVKNVEVSTSEHREVARLDIVNQGFPEPADGAEITRSIKESGYSR